MLVDTHCHLDFERFDADRDAVVARATSAGVRAIVVPALDLESCRSILALSEQYQGVFAAVGIHPNASAGWRLSWVDRLREFADHPKVVAIGEIGLDYYWDKSPKDIQHEALAAQLALAADLELPVILHNREASDDVINLLSDSPLRKRDNPGVLHSFSANWEIAQEALALGYYLGVTGPVTYKKADVLRDVVGRAPLDRLLVETDAPFLAPQAHRGKRNEPAYVALVAERVADIRGIAVQEIGRQTTENAARLFGQQLMIAEE